MREQVKTLERQNNVEFYKNMYFKAIASKYKIIKRDSEHAH